MFCMSSCVSNFGSSFSVWAESVLFYITTCAPCRLAWHQTSVVSSQQNHLLPPPPLNFSVSTSSAKCFHISPLGLQWHKLHSHIKGLRWFWRATVKSPQVTSFSRSQITHKWMFRSFTVTSQFWDSICVVNSNVLDLTEIRFILFGCKKNWELWPLRLYNIS